MREAADDGEEAHARARRQVAEHRVRRRRSRRGGARRAHRDLLRQGRGLRRRARGCSWRTRCARRSPRRSSSGRRRWSPAIRSTRRRGSARSSRRRRWRACSATSRRGATEGAQLLAGGERTPVNGKGYFVQPTIFGGVKPKMTIAREEIFGPVLAMMTFRRRRRRRRARQRHDLRPRRRDLDARHREGAAHRARDPRRHGLGQHLQHVRRGGAASAATSSRASAASSGSTRSTATRRSRRCGWTCREPARRGHRRCGAHADRPPWRRARARAPRRSRRDGDPGARRAHEARRGDDRRRDLRLRQPGRARTIATSRGWRSLLAGLPVDVPAQTVNRLCASGLQAIVSAAHAMRAGEGDVFIAGGVESMSRAPWVTLKPEEGVHARRPRVGGHHRRLALRESEDAEGVDDLARRDGRGGRAPLQRVARRPGRLRPREPAARGARRSPRATSRPRSCRCACRASAGAETVVDRDEHPRPDTTLESLARDEAGLPEGRRHGHRRQCERDQRRRQRGAASCRPRSARRGGRKPMARVVATAVAGVVARGDGARPRARGAEGARARRAHDAGDRSHRAERGLRVAGDRVHARARA